MKRRWKRWTAVLLCIALLIACCACGKTEPAGQGDPASGQNGTPAGDASGQGGESSGQSGETSGQQGGGQTVAKTSEELYQDFLRGEALVNIDYAITGLPAGIYTAPEIVQSLCRDLAADEIEYFLDQVWYAFIDCGLDGEPELAVSFILTPSDDDWFGPYEAILIVKNFDGELCVVADDYSEYRVNCSVSETGMLTSGGSSSAFSYYLEYSFINAYGERHFLYSGDYEMGLAEPMIPGSLLPSDALTPDLDAGYDYDENGYELDVYNFNKFEAEMVDDEASYDEYKRGNQFVLLDMEGNDAVLSDERRAAYEAAGVRILSSAEWEAALRAHLEQCGAVEGIPEGEPADWQQLDPEEIDWMPKG